MQTNKPADYPITAGGKIKRAIFAIIPLLHGFCREVLYGQVAQSVEQRIELSENQICPRHLSEITIKRFCFEF